MTDVIVISSGSEDDDDEPTAYECCDCLPVPIAISQMPDLLLGCVSMAVYRSEARPWDSRLARDVKTEPGVSPPGSEDKCIERPKASESAGVFDGGARGAGNAGSPLRPSIGNGHGGGPASGSAAAAAAAAAAPALPGTEPPRNAAAPRKRLRLWLSHPPAHSPQSNPAQQPEDPPPPPLDPANMDKAVRRAIRKERRLQKVLGRLRPGLARLRELAETSCRLEVGVKGLGQVDSTMRKLEAMASREQRRSVWTAAPHVQGRRELSSSRSAPGLDTALAGVGVGEALVPSGMARLIQPPAPSSGPPLSPSVLIVRPDLAGSRVLRTRSDAAEVAAACSHEAAELLERVAASAGLWPAAPAGREVERQSKRTRSSAPGGAGGSSDSRRVGAEKRRRSEKRRSLGPADLTEFDLRPADECSGYPACSHTSG